MPPHCRVEQPPQHPRIEIRTATPNGLTCPPPPNIHTYMWQPPPRPACRAEFPPFAPFRYWLEELPKAPQCRADEAPPNTPKHRAEHFPPPHNPAPPRLQIQGRTTPAPQSAPRNTEQNNHPEIPKRRAKQPPPPCTTGGNGDHEIPKGSADPDTNYRADQHPPQASPN